MDKSFWISRIFVMLVVLSTAQTADAQRVIDTSVLDRWPGVQNPSISNNGKYFCYTVVNEPVGSQTLVVKNKTHWRLEIAGGLGCTFSEDSKMAIVQKTGDTILIHTLGENKFIQFVHVNSFKYLHLAGTNWLLFQSGKVLSVIDLGTGRRDSIKDVIDFWVNPVGKLLVQLANGIKSSLQWVRLPILTMNLIYRGKIADGKINSVVFDQNGEQFACVEKDTSIWFYSASTGKLERIASNESAKRSNCTVGSFPDLKFSQDGKRLFFSLDQLAKPVPPSNGVVAVDVWSYHDIKLQSKQLLELTRNKQQPKRYLHVADLNQLTVIRLQQQDDELYFFSGRPDSWTIVTERRGDLNERNWNRNAKAKYFLLSTTTGERIEIPYLALDLSPDGKYAICTDDPMTGYFKYDLRAHTFTNITDCLPIPKTDPEADDYPHYQPTQIKGIAGWSSNSEDIFIYDKYDIWKIDLEKENTFANITNGYGRKKEIAFSLFSGPDKVLDPSKKYILSAFDKRNKNNGFYRASVARPGNPQLLNMAACLYSVDGNQSFIQDEFPPIKAKDADIYIVRRANVNESPNYYITSDFKTFEKISDVHPEMNYNWPQAELVNFKGLDSQLLQGILYKPTSFSPTKKYPVIIHYYEKMSDHLHKYDQPEAAKGSINIPWFVSRDYLIFTPDISYKIGYPGTSALNSVEGAARYLSSLPFVDNSHIGLQGHSFGGFETNFIITRSHRFAAAVSAAGPSDFVSGYNSIAAGNGMSLQFFYELSQSRIGTTLWENPSRYLENSPVLHADKVNTPLLIMHNKEDGIVPFNQGIEFFTALRRLGKKVWMLQYDGSVHSVFGKVALDYTIRMTQFFDYYLKTAKSPVWMTKGIPASQKGVTDGLEITEETTTPAVLSR